MGFWTNMIVIPLMVVAAVATIILLYRFVSAKSTHRARGEGIASIAVLLRSGEKTTRMSALKLLASFPPSDIQSVQDALWALLRDTDTEVRSAATRLMSTLYPQEQLLRQLAGKDVRTKLDAIELLAAVGNGKTLAALLETGARAPEEQIRQAARAALARSHDPETTVFLINSLGSRDAFLRGAAKEVFRMAGSNSLTALLAALRDPRKTIRATTASLIGDLAIRDAADALISTLTDPVDEVRGQAAQALGKLPNPGPATVSALLRALSDTSNRVREESATSLAEVGDPTALIPVLEFLRANHDPVSSQLPPAQVIQFIAGIFPHEPSALEAWSGLLSTANETLLHFIAQIMNQAPDIIKTRWLEQFPLISAETQGSIRVILHNLGLFGLSEPFRLALHDASPLKASMRAAAIRLMGEIGAVEFGEDLFAALSDTDAQVRRVAAWAAGRIPHFAAVDGLCQALSDPDTDVRIEAARSLTYLAEKVQRERETSTEAIDQLSDQLSAGLLQAVNDPVTSVRAEVAHALGAARLTAATPSLVAWALADEHEDVREAAADALTHMESSDTLPLLAEALSYTEPEVRTRAAELLGRIGDPAGVPHLIRSLQDSNAQVREKAGRALWELGSAGHDDVLMIHLQSPDPRIRGSIAGLLGKVRSERALDGLAHALRDPNEFVRAAVVNALARFGRLAIRHLPALVERMEDPDQFVRMRAARAILEVGDGDARAADAIRHVIDSGDSTIFSDAIDNVLEFAQNGHLEPLLVVVSDTRARGAIIERLGASRPERLRSLLTQAQSIRGEAQAMLLSLLMEAMKSIGSVDDYKQDLATVDPAARIASLDALSLLINEDATAVIADVLTHDPVAEVRRHAALLLARIPSDTAQTALRKAAENDLEEEVREVARSHVRLTS
jgi:HEAT repeat protein